MNSNRLRSLLVIAMLVACVGRQASAQTQPTEATLASRTQDVAKLFCEHPGGYEVLFAPSFLAQVPGDALTGVIKGIFSTNGACIKTTPISQTGDFRGKFSFVFHSGAAAVVHLSIEPKAPHLIDGLFLEPFHLPAKSFDEVIASLKKLPGKTSLFAARIDGEELSPLAQLNADKPLALGSAFKLYVLAELVREIDAGTRHWGDIVPLTEQAKSLPSGKLQNWPVGSPLTLHTLASLMISESDNTATDQLILALGREKIEAGLADAGNSTPDLNIPFLTTMEMFKLRIGSSEKLADEYARGTVEDRRKMIAGLVAGISRDGVDANLSAKHLSDIEWFASTTDMARAMRWLKSHTQSSPASDARGVLSINPGLPQAKGDWDYVGYKGGSEPGVLSLNFLLHKSNAGWYAVSLIWNNAGHDLDESTLLQIAQQAIDVTGQSASPKRSG